MIVAFRAAGERYLLATTAFGAYDHGLFLLAERRGFPAAPALIRRRAARAILATEAIERPLTFADNDRPGIMSLQAGQSYLNRHRTLVGQRIAILSTGHAEPAAAQFRAAGAEVEMIEAGEGRTGVEAIDWHGAIRGLTLSDGRRIAADTILTSGGWTPAVHLHCQAGGKLDWREDIQAFTPAPTGPSCRPSARRREPMAQTMPAPMPCWRREGPDPRPARRPQCARRGRAWANPGEPGWISRMI